MDFGAVAFIFDVYEVPRERQREVFEKFMAFWRAEQDVREEAESKGKKK